MIKINLLSSEQRKVNEAVAAFNTAHIAKSFSGRHPELGRMVKCQVCQTRHRDYIKCQQKFAVGRYDLAPEGEKKILMADQTTRNGVMGAASVKGKRLKPHPNSYALQILERVKVKFPEKHLDLPAEAFGKLLKSVRADAVVYVDKKLAIKAGKKRRQQDVSRRINNGLLVGGSR